MSIMVIHLFQTGIAMDLTNPKVTDDEKFQLCRKYFLFGWALLPFLWAVNAIWFFREAFVRPPFPQQKAMKTYVVMSGVGSLIWWAILISWIVTFVSKRAEWGELGDRLAFNIPTGAR